MALLDRAAIRSANYAEGIVQDQHAARRGRGGVRRDRLAIFKLIGAMLVFAVSSAVLSLVMLGLLARVRMPRRLESARGRK